MIRSLYTAANGMLLQQKKMDILTNNIANVETTGFKKDGMVTGSFANMLISRINANGATAIGTMTLGANVAEQYTDYTQGSLDQTDRMLDFALTGDGYFAVTTQNGTMYTRDGNFTVSADGYLVTNDGNYVQNTAGNKIYVGSGTVSVDASGNLSVNGAAAGTLKIVAFADNTLMQKAGNNLYTTTQTPVAAAGTTLKQGYLEASNVDMAEQIVNMMSINRTYEVNQRIVKMIDETLNKTVNEVGKV